MANLLTLRTRIKADLSVNGTEYDTQVDDAIRSALRNRRGAEFWFLEKTDTITLTSATNSVSLPSDFANPISFRLSSGGVWKGQKNGFQFISYNKLETEYLQSVTLATGIPAYCAVLNTTIYTDKLASSSLTIQCRYYRKDASLPTDDTDTSVWFDDGYDVIRADAMLLFKRESQQFTATEEDGQLAAYHYGKLCERAQKYETRGQ